ncbi:MAG: hypothetical protein JO033_11150 [Acidobacteriaceae bacterium]|nr:hypothetical protein [Acidobacteriaceae bacterium]
MKRSTSLLLVFLFAGFAFGQTAVTPPEGPPPMMPPHRGMEGPGMGIGRSLMKVVTGAPYSADITNTLVQTLADGNTIQRTTTGRVARDAQGRTYVQENIRQGPFTSAPTTLIFITDPVAGYAYTLHTSEHTATKHPFKAPPAGQARSEMPRHPEGNNATVVETDLGIQSVGGVTAQGKSITRTIQAGAIGNTMPLVSKTETWYSPELQVAVKSVHTDPRIGESTYTLTNIQRGNPDPSLFQIPQGYSVRDVPNFRGPGGPGGPPPPGPPQE